MLKLCDILLKTGYQFKLKGWHHCVITLSCIYKLCSNQGTKQRPLLGSHFLGKWEQRLFYLPPNFSLLSVPGVRLRSIRESFGVIGSSSKSNSVGMRGLEQVDRN